MRFAIAVLLACLATAAPAQEETETREFVGQVGSRSALLVLHSRRVSDGSWRLAGEYVLLGTLTRRYLDGEASPEIGVTTLREGNTPILFGRPPSAELRGSLRPGFFRGMRYGPAGQERERFDFSEEFPAMTDYSATVRCEAGDGRYASSLAYGVEAGKLKSLEWRARVEPSGHSCNLAGAEQHPYKGGLLFVAGRCNVTLRDLGEYVRVSAENCTEQCGSQAYFEPLLVDKRGNCRLMRPESR
jgi:hypothetical protein